MPGMKPTLSQASRPRIIKKNPAGTQEGQISKLSDWLENKDPNDFYLRPPDKNSSSYLKCKIYFFNSPQFLEIEVSQNDHAIDVIRHVMTLYRKS